MHSYVFWRLSSLPWVASHLSLKAFVALAFALWASYPVARILEAKRIDTIGLPLERFASNWIGVLFLLLAAVLFVDVVTWGGWLFPEFAVRLLGGSVIAAFLLAAIALAQGARPPVLRDYELQLPGLPTERDELTIVAISDLHLGTQLGERWLGELLPRINALQPDLLLIVGDLVDGNVSRVEPLLPKLRSLHAPLGVWAVTGNHEFYAGLDESLNLFQSAGFSILRDRWAEVTPGLILAGVDDLTARREFADGGDALANSLAHRPPGTTILLSHSPMRAEEASAAGVNLMLSGHTHNGQIWPFNHLVALRYPRVGGRYEIDGMTLIVSRGAGTWGPRMRLWRPSEILRIRLRSP